MTKLVEIITDIKKRPGMYLGSTRSLNGLRCFLTGYMCAHDNRDSDGIGADLMRFNSWLEKRLRIRTKAGWVENIVYHCGVCDYDALDEFFELFEEFLKEDTLYDRPQI